MSNTADDAATTDSGLRPAATAAVAPARRAGRPPRLTAVAVIDEAIRYADGHGLDALSMPKLAKQLGVGTMTLYGYVASKRDLLDRMAARLFEDIRMVAAPTWQEQLTAYFQQFRNAATTHPCLSKLLSTVRVDLTPIADDLEALLGTMHADGVARRDALRTFDAAFAYTLGFVMQEAPNPDANADPLTRLGSFLATAESGSYTSLERTVVEERDDPGRDRFLWGLERLLDD